MNITSCKGTNGDHIFFISREDMVVIRQKVVQACVADGLFGVGDHRDDLGIKDVLLLQSAVDRQMTGMPYGLKYGTVYENAATLAFGLCANHAYHDGNKRTALIATLAHLDKNGVMPSGVSHPMLADVMENVADRRVPVAAQPPSALTRKAKMRAVAERATDMQVVADLAIFLRQHSHRRSKSGGHNLRYADLRRVLECHNFFLVGPVKNKMEIMRPKPPSVIGKLLGRHREAFVHVATVGWPGDSKSVRPGALNLLRDKLHMREEDGYDDMAFYSLEDALDPLINEYRGVLRRLRNR